VRALQFVNVLATSDVIDEGGENPTFVNAPRLLKNPAGRDGTELPIITVARFPALLRHPVQLVTASGISNVVNPEEANTEYPRVVNESGRTIDVRDVHA
jgi:hypothetical protein